jgi:hypothetical protein
MMCQVRRDSPLPLSASFSLVQGTLVMCLPVKQCIEKHSAQLGSPSRGGESEAIPKEAPHVPVDLHPQSIPWRFSS